MRSLALNATRIRSMLSEGSNGTRRSNPFLTVAPESPFARQLTGRPVIRANDLAVAAATVSSDLASPTPEIEDSPSASNLIAEPLPAMVPWCGGFAGGRIGTLRRVIAACMAATGKSATEHARPTVSNFRDAEPFRVGLNEMKLQSALGLLRSSDRTAILPSASKFPLRLPAALARG